MQHRKRLATVWNGKRVLRIFHQPANEVGEFFCEDIAPAEDEWGTVRKGYFNTREEVIDFFSKDDAGRELLRKAQFVD